MFLADVGACSHELAHRLVCDRLGTVRSVYATSEVCMRLRSRLVCDSLRAKRRLQKGLGNQPLRESGWWWCRGINPCLVVRTIYLVLRTIPFLTTIHWHAPNSKVDGQDKSRDWFMCVDGQDKSRDWSMCVASQEAGFVSAAGLFLRCHAICRAQFSERLVLLPNRCIPTEDCGPRVLLTEMRDIVLGLVQC
jgi:hypothetical protein